MSLFRVVDEHEILFEPLEERDAETSILAHSLYIAMGHQSARRSTDGAVTRPMINKRCAHWPAALLDRAIAALVEIGAWLVTRDGWCDALWAKTQPSASRVTAKREMAAARKRAQRAREKKTQESGNVTRDIPRDVTRTVTPGPRDSHADRSAVRLVPPANDIQENGNVTRDVTRTPSPSPSPVLKPLSVDKPTEPPVSDQIRALEARYEQPELLADVRTGCALTRKCGRIADSVWLTTLQRLAGIDLAHARAALQSYADRYADGDKGEAYLLAIARGMAKRAGRTPVLRDVPPTAPEEQVGEDGLTDFDRQFVVRRGEPSGPRPYVPPGGAPCATAVA